MFPAVGVIVEVAGDDDIVMATVVSGDDGTSHVTVF